MRVLHTFFDNMAKVVNKLNILCLHGYFQDAMIMKERIPALYRKLKSIANFCKPYASFYWRIDYLDGPYVVNSMEGYKPELGDTYC